MIQNTNRRAYNATIELAFENNGQRTKIESEKISYVMIEHDYENQVLPIIYVSLSANDFLYKSIINYKNTAKFYLRICKVDKNSSSSVSKETLAGSFNYVTSTSNPNFREDINLNDYTMQESSYRRITIGLVSIELTNKLRKSFNGLYKNIDQKTLLAMAIEGTKCIIENPTYNTTYSTINIPPLSSRYKMIEYIFDKDNFYDTKFRYFMDFRNSYLLSKCGNYIDAGDGDLSSVIIDIKSVTANEAYYDGMEIKNGSYYIYINPAESHVSLNQGTEKVANQIVSIDEDESIQTLDLNINSTQGSTTKQLFVRTDNAALYKNELETNTVSIEVLKHNIDGSHITPNKIITVNNFGEYSKYNGKYIMNYKKEFYKCTAGEFYLSCILGLRKVGNIVPSKIVSNPKQAKYGSKSATRKTSKTKTNNNKMFFQEKTR